MDADPRMRAMREANPQAAAMFSNPDFMRQMADPANLQAMMQLQQATRQLQDSGLMPGMQMPGMGMFGPPLGQNNGTSGTQSSSESNSSGSTSSTTSTNAGGNFDLANMFSMLGNQSGGQGTSTGGSTQVPPEQMYETQLQKLEEMGFTDRSANIRALQQTGGNVNAA